MKRTINQCQISYMRKTHFFCKNVLLYTIINISMVLEIIISKFFCILKMTSRNTFPQPKPESASYVGDDGGLRNGGDSGGWSWLKVTMLVVVTDRRWQMLDDNWVIPYKSTKKIMIFFFWIFDQKSQKFLIF